MGNSVGCTASLQAAQQEREESRSSSIKDHASVNKIIFPAPPSSYDPRSFPGELAWIPRRDEAGSVPVLILPAPRASTVILYMHGNGTDIGMMHDMLTELRRSCNSHVIAVEYPGYGISDDGGQTSEYAVVRDTQTVFDFITAPQAEGGLGWSPQMVIPFGRSIGTGPASRLAASRPVRGCVLVSPYTSIRGMVGALVSPALAWLVSDRFVTIEEVRKPGYPDLLVFHGTDDDLIPFSQGEAVVEACNAARKVMVPLEGCGHNDIFRSGPLHVMGEAFNDFFADLHGESKELSCPPTIFTPPESRPDAVQERMMAPPTSIAKGVVSQMLETSASVSSSGTYKTKKHW